MSSESSLFRSFSASRLAAGLFITGMLSAAVSVEAAPRGAGDIAWSADPSKAAAPLLSGDLTTRLEQRSRGGGGGGGSRGGGGGQAVPRGGGGGGGTVGDGGGGGPRGGSAGAPAGGPRTRSGGEAGSGGAPTYSRPRDGRVATGQAVQRRPGSAGGGGGGTVFVPGGGYWGGFYPWGWGGLGFGGLYGGYWGGWGGGFYDPWMYGGYGGGYSGYPVGGGGFYADGGLKLKMKPRNAEVFVDGYFAGQVDNYDGLLQRLRLEPGPHRVEVRLDGYEPLSFEVRILPDRTISYKGDLKKIGETN